MLINVKGGNTGVKAAKGEYILFIDVDDFFVEQSLPSLKKALSDAGDVDLLFFDFQELTDNVIKHYNGQHFTEIVTGKEYICRIPIPWTPWCNTYKRTFLLENNLLFEENVRFEDADFVMGCLLAARKVCFRPIEVVQHIIWGEATTQIGNNFSKIEELYKQSQRIKMLAEHEIKTNTASGSAVMGHHLFNEKMNMRRYLWRLPYKNICYILKTYRAHYPSGDTLVDIGNKHPAALAAVFCGLKPLLYLARNIYARLKK